jgi:hypothetical protein
MNTWENLLSEVEKEDSVEKVASEKTETLEMLETLKSSMEKNASQERVMKYASAAGAQFAKSAADKFAEAAETFVDIVSTDEFAEKVATLILEKLAVETSTETIHSTSESVKEEDPRTAIEKQQMNQDLAQPNKVEAKKQELIDKELQVDAVTQGEGTLLKEKKASVDALSALRELLSSEDY